MLVKSEEMEVDSTVHVRTKPVAMATTRSASQQITPSELFTPAEVN